MSILVVQCIHRLFAVLKALNPEQVLCSRLHPIATFYCWLSLCRLQSFEHISQRQQRLMLLIAATVDGCCLQHVAVAFSKII